MNVSIRLISCFLKSDINQNLWCSDFRELLLLPLMLIVFSIFVIIAFWLLLWFLLRWQSCKCMKVFVCTWVFNSHFTIAEIGYIVCLVCLIWTWVNLFCLLWNLSRNVFGNFFSHFFVNLLCHFYCLSIIHNFGCLLISINLVMGCHWWNHPTVYLVKHIQQGAVRMWIISAYNRLNRLNIIEF